MTNYEYFISFLIKRVLNSAYHLLQLFSRTMFCSCVTGRCMTCAMFKCANVETLSARLDNGHPAFFNLFDLGHLNIRWISCSYLTSCREAGYSLVGNKHPLERWQHHGPQSIPNPIWLVILKLCYTADSVRLNGSTLQSIQSIQSITYR